MPIQALLTPPADHSYNLRDRPHNRQLPGRMSHLTNCNFIVRMLFCDCIDCIHFYHLVFYRFTSVYNCGLAVVLFDL